MHNPVGPGVAFRPMLWGIAVPRHSLDFSINPIQPLAEWSRSAAPRVKILPDAPCAIWDGRAFQLSLSHASFVRDNFLQKFDSALHETVRSKIRETNVHKKCYIIVRNRHLDGVVDRGSTSSRSCDVVAEAETPRIPISHIPRYARTFLSAVAVAAAGRNADGTRNEA